MPSSHLDTLRVQDPILTELAQGYKNGDMVADILFPVVPVDKETVKIPRFGPDHFKAYETRRAVGAKSNRMQLSPEDYIRAALDEHDLEAAVDYRSQKEAMFSQEARATLNVQRILTLNHERRSAVLALNPDNYLSGSKITLSGTSQFSDAGSDPVSVIAVGKEAIRKKIGTEPNTIVMGKSVYNRLTVHPKLIDIFKYVERGLLTLEHLRAAFGIPTIGVGSALTADDSGVLSDIWGDSIVLAYVPTKQEGVDRDEGEPSYGYTFRMRNHPWVDTYIENGGKIKVIRNTDNLTEAIVGQTAGYLISDCLA